MTRSLNQLQRRSENLDDQGFTLIELLIVIVVLGILAAVVVFALGSVTGNAKSSACVSDAKTVETAVGVYNAQNSNSISTETGDGIQVASTAGITAGATVTDLSRSVATTTVVLVNGSSGFTVPTGASAVFHNGDLIDVGGSPYGITGFIANNPTILVGTPSSYPNGSQAQLLLAPNLLKSWPGSANGYSISLSVTKAGNVSIYVPATSLTPIDYETESSITGCNNPNI